VGHVIFDEIGSTMDAAREAAFACDRPTWFFARHQTAARGRGDRVWRHPRGNFAASLVFDPWAGPMQAAWRSFTAALALRDALIASGVPPGALSLKWPNDVLLNGGKLAGILLEGLPNGDRVGRLIVGIGVNLAEAPPQDGNAFPPVALAGVIDPVPTPEALLTRIAAAFAPWEAELRAHRFAVVREAWLAHAARLGEEITVTTPQGRVTGRFETVDAHGLLVLATPGGTERFASADIAY
jgi:BirA family biotin operon repressor/biotin-[acetyl-CoA-carboxylase] ligase